MCVCARRCTSLATRHLELFSKMETAAMAMTRREDDDEASVINYHRSTSVRKQTEASCLQHGAYESERTSRIFVLNRTRQIRSRSIERRWSAGVTAEAATAGQKWERKKNTWTCSLVSIRSTWRILRDEKGWRARKRFFQSRYNKYPEEKIYLKKVFMLELIARTRTNIRFVD